MSHLRSSHKGSMNTQLRPSTLRRLAAVGRPRPVTRIAVAEQDTRPLRTVPLPEKAQEQCIQAAEAIKSAYRAGVKRQCVQLLLPLIGATDLDDWPGGIRQQFKACQPMVEQILRSVKQVEELQGPLQPEIWDQGDAVACYRSQKLACVIFPTGSTIGKLKKLVEEKPAPELLIIVNPQWESQGPVVPGLGVSDFGIGPWRAQNEALARSFTNSYHLKSLRVYGDVVHVLYAHPNEYQVIVSKGGTHDCIARLQEMPSYKAIEDILRARPESSINKSISERLQEEWEFNRKSLDQPR